MGKAREPFVCRNDCLSPRRTWYVAYLQSLIHRKCLIACVLPMRWMFIRPNRRERVRLLAVIDVVQDK
jgi:hypothetical protein